MYPYYLQREIIIAVWIPFESTHCLDYSEAANAKVIQMIVTVVNVYR